MSLIGQPESYSDILKRIFAATLTVGVLCTFALAAVSPAVRTFLESWTAETSIGILDSVKALYLLIPLLVAVLARVFLLHDKISDLLGIRRRFDIANIIRPLAEGVGLPTAGAQWNQIEESRDLAMSRTFYPYASFNDPKINLQLVRTAADRWAWFWCTVEPLIILLIAGLILAILGAWFQFSVVLACMAILMLVGLLLWPQLRTGARNEVAEILNNGNWKAEIRSALDDLSGGMGDPPAGLAEFLFVDERRLNSYLEQFGAPVTYDKVPVWIAGRPPSRYEKVRMLLSYLCKNELIEDRREEQKSERISEFRLENCRARKAFIPSLDPPYRDFKGLSVWISPSLGRLGPGMLFLVEDFQGDDSGVTTRPSGYSALLTLLEEVAEQFSKTIVAGPLDQGIKANSSETLARFARSPLEFLRDLGAIISDVRQIQVLYRIRATLLDCSLSDPPSPEPESWEWSSYYGTTTVGYPIFVVEGGVPLKIE